MPAKKSETRERLLLCINATLQKKTKDVVVLNLKEISTFTDYMITCSGTSEKQVQAISAGIQEFLKKAGIKPLGVEGNANGQWILLDNDDVVIVIKCYIGKGHYEIRTYFKLYNHRGYLTRQE